MEEPEVGGRLGRYVLEVELGRGAMGTVYRAVRDDGMVVALKVAAPELARDPIYRRRFEREGRIAASLVHPHILHVIEAGEHDGTPFLASRLVEGQTLAERIASEGPLPESDVVRIVAELASALDALHERELLHRDLKPANVLLTPGGAALSDFGLARGAADTVLTQPGRVSGTADYLAPELIRGAPATAASDIYGLGCLAYECLAGTAPFASRPVAEAIVAHLETEPAPLASPLSAGVLQALAKDPLDRPPTATAYALMLRVSLH